MVVLAGAEMSNAVLEDSLSVNLHIGGVKTKASDAVEHKAFGQTQSSGRVRAEAGSDKRLLFQAAALSAGISCALFNPLDCLRVRWQVAPKSDPRVARGLFWYGYSIVKKEGLIHGLWRPGLGANVAGMSLSAGLRFGYYETVRDAISTLSGPSQLGHERKKHGAHMVLAGLACGAAAYVATAPFHLLKTMIQAEKGIIGADGLYTSGPRVGKPVYVNSLLPGALKLAREGGLASLWKGSLPLSARGALFTAGQMLGYDGLKTYARIHHGVDDCPVLHVVASLSASFVASFMSAPADLLMARYMTSQEQSILYCINSIYTEYGIYGFWRGWPLFFFRLTPVMLTYSTLYEQCRCQMGLGYMS